MSITHVTRTLATALVVVSGLTIAIAAPAAARIVERGEFHDEFTDTDEDFCGAGLEVEFDVTVDGRYQINTRGPGSVGYYLEHVSVVTVFTDVATGQTATDIQPNTVGKDLSITDNGDGTLTIIVLLTGGARTYGPDGTLIARNSGQVRFKNVVDAETFEEISSELIFGSTGTNDDFCEAVLGAWGYL